MAKRGAAPLCSTSQLRTLVGVCLWGACYFALLGGRHPSAAWHVESEPAAGATDYMRVMTQFEEQVGGPMQFATRAPELKPLEQRYQDALMLVDSPKSSHRREDRAHEERERRALEAAVEAERTRHALALEASQQQLSASGRVNAALGALLEKVRPGQLLGAAAQPYGQLEAAESAWGPRESAYHRLWSERLGLPLVVHHTWKSTRIPQGLLPQVQTWRGVRGWRHVLHTDADNMELVRTRYPRLLPLYSRLSPIQQADVARMLIMHAYGGVYVDLDMQRIRPLEVLLHRLREAGAGVVLGAEPAEH